MHWILQNDIYAEAGWKALVEALDRFHWPYSVHKVVPFVGELVPDAPLDLRNVICMGSHSMRHLARRKSWFPGVFDLSLQDFTQQRSHWGNHMLNADSAVTTVREAVFRDEVLFVRPVSDSKCFAGHVFTRDEFMSLQEALSRVKPEDGGELTPDTRIQLAKPVAIAAEYRFWMVKGRIVTKSLYKQGGRILHSSEVEARFDHYVEERLKEWAPHETFVMDVGDTADGIKIIEINTLNSCGFYAADVERLALALDEAYNAAPP